MIWLLCGYIVLYVYRPFEIWPVLGAIRLERVFMLIVLAAWLVDPQKKLVRNPLNLAFLVLYVVVVAAWLTGPYTDQGIMQVEDFTKIGIFYILVMTTVRDEKGLRTIILTFLVSMGIYMTHSFWEYLGGRHRWSGMGLSRMIGVDMAKSSPNMFAATILYALPMLLPFWTVDAKTTKKAALLGFLILSITCIALTGSRTSFVGLVFLAVITAVVVSRHRVRSVIYIAILGGIAWVCLPQEKQDRYMTIIDSSRGRANALESAVSRKEYFLIGVELWKENPILGLGPGSFPIASGTDMNPHGLYTQVLSELGTFGAAALLFLLAAFYKNSRQMKRLTTECPALLDSFPYRVSRAVSIGVFLLLLVGLAGHNLFRYTWMWFGAFQAIALSVAARYADPMHPHAYVDAMEYDTDLAGYTADPVNRLNESPTC